DTLRVAVSGPAAVFDEALGMLLARGLRIQAPKRSGPADPESIASPMRRGLALLDRAASSGAVSAAPPGPFAVLVGPFDSGAVRERLAALAAGWRPPGAPRAARRGAAAGLAAGRNTSSIAGIPQGALLLALPGDADAATQEAVAWILHHNYSGRL